MAYFNEDGVLMDGEPDLSGTQQVSQVPPMPINRPAMGLPEGMFVAQQPGPPRIGRNPDSRMDLWRNLLGDFTWSLASAAEAGAKAPPGQRNRAAFAGALRGPFERRKYEQELSFSQQREQSLKDAA